MRGEASPSVESRRYWKFGWNDLNGLPPIGKMDYQPKGGLFRMFAEGVFHGEHLQIFPSQKTKGKLAAFGRCVYCGRDQDENGLPLKLTSEHVIPEFLGAGLELPDASCPTCQSVTATFEAFIAREIFDPVRKSIGLVGKHKVLRKSNFPLDVGRETTTNKILPVTHYPTILVLPALYPAASYSRRPKDADDPFNFRMFNINADPKALQEYAIDQFSSQCIDMVRFAQMIAKIAHVYAMHHFGYGTFKPLVAEFARTDYPLGAQCKSHLEHVGCLWEAGETPSQNLHEIEVGRINWDGRIIKAVRVRLFASYDMPNYYVSVGS